MPFPLDDYEFTYPTTRSWVAGDWGFGREPVLRRLPDGSLISLIYSGGPTEPHDENVVLAVHSTDDGATWTAPEVLFRHAVRGVWATEIFTAADPALLFLHTLDAGSHYLELTTFVSHAVDGGRAWSEPASLPGPFATVIVRQGVVLRDGAWLLPVYWQEAPSGFHWEKPDKRYRPHAGWRFRSGVLRSTDRGATWSAHGRIAADVNLWEPNVVETAPGHLVMLLRAEGQPVKFRADSADGGLTWSAPRPTDIPDANSKITLLQHGDAVIMLHNPSGTPGWHNRTSLELWVSRDGCQTWPVRRVLARTTKPGPVICYPHGFVESQRGRLCLMLDGVKAHYYLTVPLADLAG